MRIKGLALLINTLSFTQRLGKIMICFFLLVTKGFRGTSSNKICVYSQGWKKKEDKQMINKQGEDGMNDKKRTTSVTSISSSNPSS